MDRTRSRLAEMGIDFFDMWYMDDGQLVCKAEHVDVILRSLDDEAEKIGAVRGRGVDVKSTVRILGTDAAREVIGDD